MVGNFDELARQSPQMSLIDSEPLIDMVRLRGYRLQRIQDQLKARDYGGLLVYDPVNVRYATGERNMQLYFMHVLSRSAFIPAEGRAVLFEIKGCEHLAAGLETIGEVRMAPARNFPSNGSATVAAAKDARWANEIADLMRQHAGENRRLAVDGHVDVFGGEALRRAGLDLFDGQECLMLAKAIKSDEEIACMNVATAVCDIAMTELRDAVRPGISENELWAILNHANNVHGGEFIETRLLASGGRTNPWYQEAGARIVRPGDLVVFDTDMIGPNGYVADLSRAFFCGPGRPSDRQREIYRIAHDELTHNLALIRPGVAFREFSEKAFRLPDKYNDQRIGGIVHGVGMYGEWPKLYNAHDFAAYGYDGVFEPGMTLCVESYVGEVGGSDGVKLEQQILVTETGNTLFSSFPFEEQLLG